MGVWEGTGGSEVDEVAIVYTGSLEICKDTLIATDTWGVVMISTRDFTANLNRMEEANVDVESPLNGTENELL